MREIIFCVFHKFSGQSVSINDNDNSLLALKINLRRPNAEKTAQDRGCHRRTWPHPAGPRAKRGRRILVGIPAVVKASATGPLLKSVSDNAPNGA